MSKKQLHLKWEEIISTTEEDKEKATKFIEEFTKLNPEITQLQLKSHTETSE